MFPIFHGPRSALGTYHRITTFLIGIKASKSLLPFGPVGFPGLSKANHSTARLAFFVLILGSFLFSAPNTYSLKWDPAAVAGNAPSNFSHSFSILLPHGNPRSRVDHIEFKDLTSKRG